MGMNVVTVFKMDGTVQVCGYFEKQYNLYYKNRWVNEKAVESAVKNAAYAVGISESMAIVTRKGTLHVFGDPKYGGYGPFDKSLPQNDQATIQVKAVYSTQEAFVAVKNDLKSLIVSGDAQYGGSHDGYRDKWHNVIATGAPSSLDSGTVYYIASTAQAFAILLTDSRLGPVWGHKDYAGTDAPADLNNIVYIAGGPTFFGALRNDGSLTFGGIPRLKTCHSFRLQGVKMLWVWDNNLQTH